MSITLDGTQGITTPTYGGTDTSEYLVPVTAFKNRLINSAMQIDQRNAGASVTPANGAVTYTVDRFAFYVNQASKLTVQQSSTVPAGFTKSLVITSSSAYSSGASDNFVMFQSIEGYNIADLGWGAAGASTVTLSFWARSSLTGTHSGALSNGGNTRSYAFTFTISSANTWEYKTVTIAGDTSGTWNTENSGGIVVKFNFGSGSNYLGTAGSWASTEYSGATGSVSLVGTSGATFYLTGVQLEKGSTATSFDYRPYSTELELCERYYWKGTWFGGACADDDYSVNALGGTYPTTLRTTPTVTITGGSMAGHHGTAPNAIFGNNQNSTGFSWSGAAYRSIGARASVDFNASAEL